MVTVERAAEVLGRLFDVHGLRAVVTGAANGLGFTMAEVLAECGASVTLADVDAKALDSSMRSLAERELSVRPFVVDVSDEAQVKALFDDVVAVEGGVDAVFANAGIAAFVSTPTKVGGEDIQHLEAVETSEWDRELRINLNGALFTMKHASAQMKRQGQGRIVVTSSIAGLRPELNVGYGYVASKAAILNVVRQAALELAPHGVLVNALCPGPFKGTRIGTGATFDPDPETERMWTRGIPVGRLGNLEELKGLVLLLASPAGSFITGAALVVDGGAVI